LGDVNSSVEPVEDTVNAKLSERRQSDKAKPRDSLVADFDIKGLKVASEKRDSIGEESEV